MGTGHVGPNQRDDTPGLQIILMWLPKKEKGCSCTTEGAHYRASKPPAQNYSLTFSMCVQGGADGLAAGLG